MKNPWRLTKNRNRHWRFAGDAYLKKPVSAAVLEQTITDLLGRDLNEAV